MPLNNPLNNLSAYELASIQRRMREQLQRDRNSVYVQPSDSIPTVSGGTIAYQSYRATNAPAEEATIPASPVRTRYATAVQEFCLKDTKDIAQGLHNVLSIPKIPDKVKKFIADGWWLAGGALRDYFAGFEPVDFDLYRFDKKHKISTDGQIQLITTPLPLPKVVDSYDFVCCMAALGMDKNGNWWGVQHPYFHQHSINHLLIINHNAISSGSFNPASSLMRALKFVARGWTITPEQLGLLVGQLNNRAHNEEKDSYAIVKMLQQSGVGKRIDEVVAELERPEFLNSSVDMQDNVVERRQTEVSY